MTEEDLVKLGMSPMTRQIVSLSTNVADLTAGLADISSDIAIMKQSGDYPSTSHLGQSSLDANEMRRNRPDTQLQVNSIAMIDRFLLISCDSFHLLMKNVGNRIPKGISM